MSDTTICFGCGEYYRHLAWCPEIPEPENQRPRPIDFSEPRPRARRDDPSTSHAAAASVRALTPTRRRVWEIVSQQPSTDFEIRDQWFATDGPPISDSGLRTRRSELVEMGLLADSGRTRKGPTGRAYTVWRATEFPTKGNR